MCRPSKIIEEHASVKGKNHPGINIDIREPKIIKVRLKHLVRLAIRYGITERMMKEEIEALYYELRSQYPK